MIRRTVLLLGFLALAAPAFSQPQQAETDFLKDYRIETRLGMGSMIDPQVFLLLLGTEAYLDRFFSAGVQVQLGLGSESTYVIPTFGGRFRVPIYPLKRVEASLQAGVGFQARSLNSLNFYDFAFDLGVNVDVFPFRRLPALALGLGGIMNLTSVAANATSWALFASAAYHF